ncbi:glucose 1-dehydrogenase [Lichenifustis flavocetrariae]|uniref:Glucose 1-dehydrogenase n=1 Tax=Lichenifustis flavocetrariae TaxID=2949735 RepID=A0AA41YVG2_9HYPH|nr:glucose 1-dehydrogenase [Lichenifustis flavocetrariae]MCW6509306.1 glucose 1-dehydrogenase [Lichenifustis flavocetrariae]
MELQLDGARVLITGGGRGIGAAMARGLAEAGAKVAVADIDGGLAEATAGAIGGAAFPLRIDVRDRTSVRDAVAACVARLGGLDVMFNNAGIAQVRNFLDITEEDFRTVMDVNALGVLIGMQEAIRQMRLQGTGGSIVNTASIAGKQGYEPLAHYCASKFAVVALTQAAARAFGKDNIRVNAICPGVVDTAMWRLIDKGFQDNGLSKTENEAFTTFASGAVLGRPSKAEDLVGVARFLASPESAFMTGQTLLVDGGMVFD